MSILRLIFAGLGHHARIHIAVAMGVAAATAVLTGALLVGDSVRGSLRDLTLDRLGAIDEILVTDTFFRAALAQELSSHVDFARHYSAATPGLLLRGSVKNRQKGKVANGVTVLGVQPAFWRMGRSPIRDVPRGNEIVLNERLAGPDQLNVVEGDSVVLQVGRPSLLPADSPLGRKKDNVRRRVFTVKQIIPTEGLGRFGIRASQQMPANAYMALDALQSMLELEDRANAILVAGQSTEEPANAESSATLARLLKPRLADYGLHVDRVEVLDGDRVVVRYANLTSDRMLLAQPVVAAARAAWSDRVVQPTLTYLATSIEANGRSIPYSTVTAVDSIEHLGPLLDDSGRVIGPLADDEIVLNGWSASSDELNAQPGDGVTLRFFEPETTHGVVREQSESFRLRAVVPLGGDGAPITAANDRALTPELPGVTDQSSIDDWDPPFPFDPERIRKDRDEVYWETYRATPKAFVSLATGRRLWGSRFGDTTSLRVPLDASEATGPLAEALRAAIDPATLGFRFRPIKREGLQASEGTTPFDLLFLLFSTFLMAAALMLIALLYRLGIEQRADEVGLLLAVGFSRRRVAAVFLGEGLAVAIDGALAGLALGVGYAWLLMVGLRTWWMGAIGTPLLQLHVTSTSLALGLVAGWVVSGITIVWSLRCLRRQSVRQLLAGQVDASSGSTLVSTRIAKWISVVSLLGALGLVPVALHQANEMRAGLFFGAGALTLLGLLIRLEMAMQSAGRFDRSSQRIDLNWLALRNLCRNPRRSTLTIGLIASASFLIVAVSAFYLSASQGGAGGYGLMATSTVPLHFDWSDRASRFELGLDGSVAESLAEAEIVSLRVRDGDDASCLNLYQPRQPRVLGVPPTLSDSFDWAGRRDTTESAWSALQEPLAADGSGVAPIPVVLDQNTALYSMHLLGGVGATFTIENGAGKEVTRQVVGLLKNSIFQGDVLMSEANLVRLFPSVEGYRAFLLRVPDGTTQAITEALEDRLADYGFDAIDTRAKMESLLVVQNTYLSTFQSLGGLGLLLGTFGLAAVQTRSVLARRGEFAVLRATGFRRRRIEQIVRAENRCLLVAGLSLGLVSSAIALLPSLLLGEAMVPWWTIGAMLFLVLAVGALAGRAAVRAATNAPLLPALRGD